LSTLARGDLQAPERNRWRIHGQLRAGSQQVQDASVNRPKAFESDFEKCSNDSTQPAPGSCQERQKVLDALIVSNKIRPASAVVSHTRMRRVGVKMGP